ncbi:MAG TPA: serine/threonine-protein kinase [Kofleriaceae bacterium]|nr:serine/threonine-protein kinase [Kofleriaceae bacterium]
MKCPHCQADVLDIDVKCASCGAALGSTGAHRMIGQLVLGTYELVDVLGQGGMSVVFKARHKLTDQEVALKILPPELAANSQVKSRFLDEAKALAALDHPHIVHLYNFGQENGSFVLAMQFVQGKTWERQILEHRRLDWRASARIAVDVLKALEYAHGRGVVHRDMKPSNVLVRAQDATATVMDFGIAKMTTSTRLTATGQTMGTVRYMSPEQVRGHEVDLRTDIYSLGATLYESLVGDTPFDGSTHFEIMTKHLSEAPKRPSSLGVELPGQVEDALMRSLAKRADDRFTSAREMKIILEASLREGDVGLVETQRLGRDAVEELRSAPISSQDPVRATSIADELEPGTSSTPVVVARRRARWPWLVLGAVAIVSAGTVGYVATHRGHGYESVAHVDGVPIVAGARFGRVLIETDGKLTPRQIDDELVKALDAMRGAAKQASADLDVIDQVVALPHQKLCDSKLYPTGRTPNDCGTALAAATFSHGNARVVLISDDASTLTDSVRAGVVEAVCVFQPENLGSAEVDKICDVVKQFAPH